MARANSEFFRYFLTLSSKKLRHSHIVLTPACCTLSAWTPRHSIRCYSSLKHLAFELNAHLPLLLRNCWVFVWRTCSHSTAHVMSWTVLLRALFALWLLTFALIATLVWSTLRFSVFVNCQKPSTYTHRLYTCLHSLRLNSSSLYPMLL